MVRIVGYAGKDAKCSLSFPAKTVRTSLDVVSFSGATGNESGQVARARKSRMRCRESARTEKKKKLVAGEQIFTDNSHEFTFACCFFTLFNMFNNNNNNNNNIIIIIIIIIIKICILLNLTFRMFVHIHFLSRFQTPIVVI